MEKAKLECEQTRAANRYAPSRLMLFPLRGHHPRPRSAVPDEGRSVEKISRVTTQQSPYIRATIPVLIGLALFACAPSPRVHEEHLPSGSDFDLKNTSEQWLSDSDLLLARQLISDFKLSEKERADDSLDLVKTNIDQKGNYYFVFNVNGGHLFVLYVVDAQKRIPISRTLAGSYAK